MEPERWRQIEDLFHEASELDEGRRAEFLSQACRDDEELQREVESLLAHEKRAARFIETPVAGIAARLIGSESLQNATSAETLSGGESPAAGSVIGPYHLLQLVGEGGMGQVWLAEQKEPVRRRVALKLIKVGMDTREVVARFQAERQALALMDHPAIAKVFDAGSTPEGRPYFVMEYVSGLPITSYCDQRKFTIRQRLELFILVCEGVQHAHQKAIIHRDLKPSNILVTEVDGKPTPRIIDFGVAKAMSQQLTPDTLFTRLGSAVGTLGYMSPEQSDSSGRDIDTRSDVYSLGVVLYELLAGALPLDFRKLAYDEILHRLREQEPSRPSTKVKAQDGDSKTTAQNRGVDPPTLVRQLRGDVDAITLKALEKDRRRRYATTSDLAADIERFLDHEPVSAHAPGALYRARKYVRRHRLGVAAASTGILLLAVAYHFRPALPPPRVIAITQLTGDEKTKLFLDGRFIPTGLLSDGARIYFIELNEGHSTLMQVSADGGEPAPVQSPPSLMTVEDISSNGSDVLAITYPMTNNVNELWDLPVLGGDPRRIGHLLASNASWGPGGSEIYYSSGDYYSSDNAIFRSEKDGSQPRKFLTTGGIAYWIRFAPDGRTLRFTEGGSLWEAGADGSHMRQVLASWGGSPYVCCGSWTSDGTYFIFQAADSNIWAMREKSDLWRKTSLAPVQLTVGPMRISAPLPSKDGRRIYFIGTTPREEVIRFDQKKQGFVPYLPGLSAEGLTFTKGGERMAYVTYPEGILWQSNADGTDRHQLTFSPMQADMPRWSPDGKQIAFTGQMPGKPADMYRISSDGGTPEQLSFGVEGVADPTWSPDGSSLAFAEGWGIYNRHLMILDLKSREIVTVPDSDGLFSPRWSPDGSYLLAIFWGNTHPNEYKPMLFDFKTRVWQKLGDTSMAYPNWTRDGKCIYFTKDDDKEGLVYRVCLNDRKPAGVVRLADAGKLAEWSGVGPDESILGTRDISIQEIYALDVKLP